MATIEVDIVFFIFDTIISFLAIPFIIGWAVWKSHKNPEFWMKLRRVGYVYIHLWNGLNQLVTIVLPLKDMDENGQFRVMKGRRYFWMPRYKALPVADLPSTELPAIPKKATEPDPLKDGLPTTYTWKGHSAALYEWDDPMPQVRVPGGSLHSMTNPRMLDALGAADDFKLMLQADNLLKMLRMSFFVSVIVLAVIVAGLGYTVFTVNSTLGHQSCILSHLDNTTAIAVLCK